MPIGTVNLMKQINLNNVTRVIKDQKSATKPQLAKLTGLSVVTINSLVEQLLKQGVLRIRNEEISCGGRPAVVYSFNEEHALALILYTAERNKKDFTHVAVVNLYGEIIVSTNTILEEPLTHSFLSIIEQMLLDYPTIKSIGIGLPGQEMKGRMEISDYHSLEGTDFIETIRNKFYLPVTFENDVNAAVLGYCNVHQCEDENVIGVYIPQQYALGTGIFLNGEIYRGKDGFAGEAKFLPSVIDWQNPVYVTKHIDNAILHLILTFTCLFNPDILVFYSTDFAQEQLPSVLIQCQELLPAKLLPTIIISNDFAADFASGIKRIALNSLEPVLYH